MEWGPTWEGETAMGLGGSGLSFLFLCDGAHTFSFTGGGKDTAVPGTGC